VCIAVLPLRTTLRPLEAIKGGWDTAHEPCVYVGHADLLQHTTRGCIVWTGGALQEKSVRMEEFGLASMYPACGAHWAPGHHGGKRACDLMRRLASIGLFGSPVLACAGKTVAPFLPFSLADLGGEIGSQVDMFMVLPVFSYFFCSTAPQAFSRPDRGKPRPARADAVKAGRL